VEFVCVADTDNGHAAADPDVEWLTPTTKCHILKNTGKLKKKMPDKFITKPYETPVVESPHPGVLFIVKFTEEIKTLPFPYK
jgi:hypothetical protein